MHGATMRFTIHILPKHPHITIHQCQAASNTEQHMATPERKYDGQDHGKKEGHREEFRNMVTHTFWSFGNKKFCVTKTQEL